MEKIMKKILAIIVIFALVITSMTSAAAASYRRAEITNMESPNGQLPGWRWVLPDHAENDYLSFMLECAETNTGKSLLMGEIAEIRRNKKIMDGDLSIKTTHFFENCFDGEIIEKKIKDYVSEQNKKWYQKYNIIQTNYVTMSHYCRCSICNGNSSGQTASGVYLSQEGFDSIAVDTRYYPLGSQFLVYVPYRDEPILVTATDTGGAIKGNKIDMYIGNKGHAVANQYGMAYGVKMEMVRRGW